LYNGQWIEPDTYQVVVGYGIAQKFSMGLLDFNKQLEILVPKPGRSTNPRKPLIKQMFSPVAFMHQNTFFLLI
jgi:lipoprotein-releasing system permease protein